MSCALVLLMAIDVVVIVCWTCPDFSFLPLPLLLYQGGEVKRKVTELVITWSQLGLYLYLSILHIFL
jgi:hypothetical protein